MTAARIDFWNFGGDHLGDTSDEVAGWGNRSSEAGVNSGEADGDVNSGGQEGSFSARGGTGGGFGGWKGGTGISWSLSDTWNSGGTEGIAESSGWGYVTVNSHPASGSLFDQESVFHDGFGESVRTEFSKSISVKDAGKIWVLGDFGLKTWNESGGVVFDGWVASVHANENVHDVAHLVEGVELGEFIWNQKLVGIGGEILVKPDGEAILTGGWSGGTVSWDPRGNGFGGVDDGRH